MIEKPDHLLGVTVDPVLRGLGRLVAATVTEQVDQHHPMVPCRQPSGELAMERRTPQQAWAKTITSSLSPYTS